MSSCRCGVLGCDGRACNPFAAERDALAAELADCRARFAKIFPAGSAAVHANHDAEARIAALEALLAARPPYYCQNCRCGRCGNTFPVETKEQLCPHGMVLADNVCGPCSGGKPNRKETAVKP